MSDGNNPTAQVVVPEPDDSDEYRPNRWTGAPSTWRSLTSQERGLAASLDKIRDSDLSVHLYNAFALKKRARDDGSITAEDELSALPEEDRSFLPPKAWTAWPLPPEDVPRDGEHIGPEDPDNAFTFRKKERVMPSKELEEVMAGVTLKLAKERFLRREEAAAEESTNISEEDDHTEAIGNSEPGSPAEQMENEYGQGSRDEDAEADLDRNKPEDKPDDPIVKEGSEPPQQPAVLKPVVSADDEKSHELLRPSIRHNLAKLDEVLMALHYARKVARKYSHSEPTTDEEIPVIEELETALKRPKGRPRKFANLPNRSKGQDEAYGQEFDDAELFRGKKTHRGRPLKVYDRLDGESQQDYLVRIARIQKRVLPAFAPPQDSRDSSQAASEKFSRAPANRATPEELDRARHRRLRPRDWSEVVGSAALVGFSPDVIARATQRCANLFGEGMDLRSMIEAPFGETNVDILSHYKPQAIPDLGSDDVIETSEDDHSGASSSDSLRRRGRTKRINSGSLRQAHMCPIRNCPRSSRGFSGMYNLKQHLRMRHEITEDRMEEYILPSDEEMDGGVHIDGFMKPLKRMRKRRRKNEGGNRALSEAESSEEELDKDDIDDGIPANIQDGDASESGQDSPDEDEILSSDG